MRKGLLVLVAACGALAAILAVALTGPGPQRSAASSHREAPLISEDPTADNTDLYAFRSPDRPDTVTVISNWIPGEDPAAGPNYYTFSNSARYNISIDTNGDVKPDLVYRFTFRTPTGPLFLGNTVQSWTATKNGKLLAKGSTPPDNIGPRQNTNVYKAPSYREAADKAIVTAPDGTRIFAGQRDDGFFADVGA